MESEEMKECDLGDESKGLLSSQGSKRPRHDACCGLGALIITLVTWCLLWYSFVPGVPRTSNSLSDLGSGPPDSDGIFGGMQEGAAKIESGDLFEASLSEPMASITTKPMASRTLVPLALTPLPLSSIKPAGWLASELSNSANGLAGHMHDFYYYVRNSSWYGGSMEYSELNEGFPYWFNGLVPLAYSLPDDDPSAARLKEQVHQAAGYVLDHQADDGWIGSETDDWSRLLWGRFPFLMGLKQLVEANKTWEARVLPAIHRFVPLMNVMITANGRAYRMEEWGRTRHADMIMTLQWILERYPSDRDDDLIWDTMHRLYEFARKWEDWFNEAVYIKEDLYTVETGETGVGDYQYHHGVNAAQGLKAPAVVHRFTHNSSLLQTVADGVQWTFQYHGAASGTILGDERIDGLSPYSGSELCTAVEAIFSLSYLYQALGTNSYADRAELAAFNALPTMSTGDHWAHQYMSMPNQPFSTFLKESPFFNSRELAQSFGMEPEYPCCTTNHPQGLPKFASNSWVRVGTSGIAHVLLSPSTVMFDKTTIRCETSYPFDETLTYKVKADAAFKFSVRVPTWAGSASSIAVDSGNATPLSPDPVTGLHELELPAGQSTVIYKLEANIQNQPRANSSIAVTRGQLLYALEVGSSNKSQPPRFYRTAFDRWKDQNPSKAPNWAVFSQDLFEDGLPDDYAPPEARDWTFMNTSAWNVAIDPATLQFHRDEAVLASMPSQIWSPGAPPVSFTAMGCEIDWPLFRNTVPGAVPLPENRKCLGEPYEVRLRPYGSQKLHMAELPTIDLSS